MFDTAERYREPWSGDIAVLSPGDIPTVDFYLTPRFGAVDPSRVFRLDSRHPARPEMLPTGTFVVIVRHAAPAWLQALEMYRDRWSGVAFLMDDDLPGAWRCGDVPLDYGLWTTGRYLRARRGLARVCDRLWMSTGTLRQRFTGTPSILVEPLPFEPRRSGPAPQGARRWGYHGTRIHQRELRWLVPIVKAVQQAVPEAEFEVFGHRAAQRLFAHVPRVTVLAPCSWPEYVAHCHRSSLAVSLAPMLPGRFNAVRSHTKVFDIARCGAVGLFSNRDPYASALKDSGAILLSDDHEAWTTEAIRLLRDDALRQACYRQMDVWLDNVDIDRDIAELIEMVSTER